MGNFIPNDADVPTFGPNSPLSGPDARDFDILLGAINGTGVVSGCAVTAQGTPNMTVAVAAGVLQSTFKVSNILAYTATIGANATGNPRFDLITVDASTPQGVVSVVQGTAAAVPVFPTYTAGRIVLAAVYVPASASSIASTQIVDKRVAPPQYVNGMTEMLVDGLQEYRRINGLTLRHWLKALANRNNIPANIWVVGDSVSECYGVTSDDQKFIWQMREALQNMYRPGGVGFIPCRHGATWLYTSNPDGKNFWTLTNLVDNVFYGWGFGDRAAFLGTVAGSVASITVDCDQFYLMFTVAAGGGTATIVIDENTAFAQTLTFSTSSTVSLSGQIWESPILPLGTHTVKVTSTTASAFVLLDGIMPFFTDKLNGIHVWDSAHSGYLSGSFDPTVTDARGAGATGFWAEAAVQPASASIFTDGSTATTATFAASASEQTFIVPTGVTSITVDCQGAKGGQGGGASGPGGNGGRVQTTLAVTPGETLKIGAATVGGANSGTAGGGAGFYAGGGGGGAGLLFGGGGGGGQSYIKQGGTADSNRVVVAGGGGGGSNNSSSGQGGGQTLSTQGTTASAATNGTGGGGAANGGGGGGGGWVGGNGGGVGNGGTGGTNMTNTGVCSSTTSTAAFNTGAGTVILTWTGSSTLLNSATAAFVANDIGEYIFGTAAVAGIGYGNQIVAVNSATQVVMSKNMAIGTSLGFKIARAQVADWSITNASTTATSATAAFNKWDEGKLLVGAAGIPAGTYIKRVNSATSIEMSKAATATASSQTVRIQNRVTYPVQPDLLIVQLGLNDQTYSVKSADFKTHINNLVTHATQRGGATYAPSVMLLDLWAPGLTLANWIDSTATVSSGQATLTGLNGDYSPDMQGLSVTGTNIPGGTTVLSVQDPFHLTLSANATGAVTQAVFVNKFTTEAMWLRYRQAMMELANENNWAFCDLYSLLGYIGTTDPQNITYDGIHPNNNGSRLIGDELNRLLGGTPKLGAVPAGVFDNVADSVWGTGIDTYTKIGGGVDGTSPVYAAAAKAGVVPKMAGSSALIGQMVPVVGGTTMLTTGLPAPTLSGTVTNADDNEAAWLNFATSTVQFNPAGIVAPAFTVTRSGRLPEFDAYVKTDPAAITSVAYAIGLSSASLDVASAVAPAASVVGAYFLYNTTVHGTATWRTCTSDGSTIKTYDTFKSIAVNTTYRLRIAIRGVRGTSIAAVDFYINDVIASTHIVNLPTFSTPLGYDARVETLTTAARNLKVARLSLSGP